MTLNYIILKKKAVIFNNLKKKIYKICFGKEII